MLDTRLAQRVVMATIMIGIALVFILSGREPGWQPFAVSGLLALSFLITAFVFPSNSQWVGLLALAVLLMAMFWERDKPMAAITGIALTILNAWSARQGALLSGNGEQKPADDSSGAVTPTEAS
jgi:membrane-bound ClpP family serine protease